MKTLIKSIRTVLGAVAVAGLLVSTINAARVQDAIPGNAANLTPGAKKELKEAAHDFGGHREDALKATDNAIEQLRKALEFDRK